MELDFSKCAAAQTPRAAVTIIYGNETSTIDAAQSYLLDRLRAAPDWPRTIARIDAAELLKTPDRLFDHFSASSLFGEAECLIVERVAERHAKLFAEFINTVDAAGSDARMILSSSDIKKKSPLLEAARRADALCLIIAAYDIALPAEAIADLARAKGVENLSRDAADRLAAFSDSHGPAATTMLLTQLSLAADESGALSDDVLSGYLPESSGLEEELAADLLLRDLAALLGRLDAERSKGEQDGRLVSALSRLCMDLKRAQSGHSAGRARPLFWKTDKIAKRAQSRIDRFPARLEAALREIHRAETTLRTTPALPEAVGERLILRLSRLLQSAGKTR